MAATRAASLQKKRHENRLMNTVFGAARFGADAGRGAVRVGQGVFDAGKEGYKFGRRVLGRESAEHQPDASDRGDITGKPQTAEQELVRMREKKLEKVLETFHPEIAEGLGELIQQAMERDISGIDMHRLLGHFFEENFQYSDRDTLAKLIRRILFVTHPDYAKHLKAE